MKTSLLLLMGLVMGVGATGAARAAPACSHQPNVEGRSLVAASTAGNGWLADLNNMLSGQQGKNDDSASDADRAHAARRPGPGYRHQPGPAQATSRGARRDPGGDHHGRTAAPVGMPAGGDQPPAAPSPDTPSTLGWQSLLPGSIQ